MSSVVEKDLDQRVAAVRSFNRFYTRQIGVLQEGFLQSRFSLAEGRVLYELAHRDEPTATEVAQSLSLDAGYLSRITAKFVDQDLVAKLPSAGDRRQFRLRLTAKGRRAFAGLDNSSNDDVAVMLGRLTASEQERMVKAMQAIEGMLRTPGTDKPSYLLRPHQPGDMGFVVARHGELYAEEHGWEISFEALVAEIVAEFIKSFEPKRERCWMAEIDGDAVGSVFLVKASDTVAKLRLLLVEPKARGLGIGRRLVDECIRFARQSGYKSITLWTQSILTPARRIYQNAGFRRVREEPHTSFGHDLIGETWERAL
jgi:DNA-binding MarR family transcriptional regulator/N-acetylglutamate synthase-like GNAT family acetyltransferase